MTFANIIHTLWVSQFIHTKGHVLHKQLLHYSIKEYSSVHPISPTHTHTQRNAFEIMMSAQRELDRKCMPDFIEEPRTNKQRLWNDVIKFLQGNSCKWKSAEVQSLGFNFVQALTDALWLINGQHNVLMRQGYSIPVTFKDFVNYNCPELHKHRKRERGNMSISVLKSVSSHLFTCLQGMYWSRDCWVSLKPDIEQLTRSLDNYSNYLQRSCKRVKFNQSSPSPVREISDHLSFQFLQTNNLSPVPTRLEELHHKLQHIPNLEPVLIEKFSPSNAKEKYQYLQSLKSDCLPYPTALLTYAHGNNIGNLNFIWKVASITESSFSDCQPVIESVKKDIPIYHTRAMRKEVFSLFGRLTSSVKPAVLRHIYRTITGKCMLQLSSGLITTCG